MGLHSKVRYEIQFKSKKRMEQEDEIVQFARGLYDFIFDFIGKNDRINLNVTRKCARFVSKAFTFKGFEDDEIDRIIVKSVDKVRKS